MGGSQSDQAHKFQHLSDKTRFSIDQINSLHKRFMTLTENEGVLRQEHLENIINLAENPIRRQIIGAFFDKRNLGQNEDGYLQEIGFEEFLTILAFFKPPKQRNSEEENQNIKKEKLRFLFNMHDTDNDGFITLDEYKRLVEELLSSNETMEMETAKAISDAAMLEVASVAMGQMGPDEYYEGITFEHFQQILKGIQIEIKMNINFWNLDTIKIQCGKSK
ncbi:tescalcin a isoform X1 [Triplophysa dalaica]|uniref:tescalcin a isoform X1 n=1 Tax=Triplophysa dalaica TaxID=1582913 RepID=UPI0024DFC0A9|nr:tescalcin a isoform X1 [Triplophysa dalaica]